LHLIGNPGEDASPLKQLSVHHNPAVTDVHMMLKRIECERRVWSIKRSQEKTECHLYLCIRWRNEKGKPPLIISCMKWWKKIISQSLKLN